MYPGLPLFKDFLLSQFPGGWKQQYFRHQLSPYWVSLATVMSCSVNVDVGLGEPQQIPAVLSCRRKSSEIRNETLQFANLGICFATSKL